jgi:ribosomal protein S18 acetylase RimI-like enzyme
MRDNKQIQSFSEFKENLNISDVSDSNSISVLNEKYIIVKIEEKDEQIAFYLFDKQNLPNLNPENFGKPEFNKKTIARAWIYNIFNLSKLGYNMIRGGREKIDLNEKVIHLNSIRVNKEYIGKGLGKLLLDFIMKNLKVGVIYLQPTQSSIDYWFHIGCKDTGYNYLDYEDIPLLKYELRD